MNHPKPMLPLSQVMAKLAKDKGIHREFRMNEAEEMRLQDSDTVYQPEDLKILKTYRFEGPSDPADNAALYVVEDNSGIKGYILDSFGADSNYDGQAFDDFLRKIPVEDHEEYSFE